MLANHARRLFPGLLLFSLLCALAGPASADEWQVDKFGDRYKVVAEVKGGFSNIVAINEILMGCVPAGLSRGMWNLVANPKGVVPKKRTPKEGQGKFSAQEFHDALLKKLNYVGVGGATESTGGADQVDCEVDEDSADGSSGTPAAGGAGVTEGMANWAKAKDSLAASLGFSVTTRVHNAPKQGTSHRKFFQKLIQAINLGQSVELYINGHLSFIGQILEYENGDIGIVMADDKTPNGEDPETSKRGPFKFDPRTGKCKNPGHTSIYIYGALIEK